MDKFLSDKQCQQILQNRFQTQEIKLIDYELKPISENAEGYMGQHFNLIITYELNGKTLKEMLFMKRKPTIETIKEMTNDTRLYKKEILFYDVLLPRFASKGYNTNFAAKSYFCIPDEAIIVENLLNKGYKLLERNQMFDMPKMKCVLRALALYHGAGFAYEKSKSAEIGKAYKFTDDFAEILQERFYCQFLEHAPVSIKFWEGCKKTISSLIKILPKDEEYKKAFLEMFLNYPLSKIFADEAKFAMTCGHGDLWSNNMMFKFDGNTPTECCLVDFQLVRYFYPAFDVLLSIYGNVDAAFRKKHIEEIYDFYYETLAGVVENYGHKINDIMTRDDFRKSINLVKPECLLQVAFTDVIIFIPKEELNTTIQKDDDTLDTLMYNNSEIAVKMFKENGDFRKRITDILEDIYEAMLAKTKNI